MTPALALKCSTMRLLDRAAQGGGNCPWWRAVRGNPTGHRLLMRNGRREVSRRSVAAGLRDRSAIRSSRETDARADDYHARQRPLAPGVRTWPKWIKRESNVAHTSSGRTRVNWDEEILSRSRTATARRARPPRAQDTRSLRSRLPGLKKGAVAPQKPSPRIRNHSLRNQPFSCGRA